MSRLHRPGLALAALALSWTPLAAQAAGAEQAPGQNPERRSARRPAPSLPASAFSLELFACNGFTGTTESGRLVRLDQTTFAGTEVDDPFPKGGLSGLAATPDGRLWGTWTDGPIALAELVELDPVTGELLSQKLITYTGVASFRLSDLAVQPGSGVLYGVGNSFSGTKLVTIDPDTAHGTIVAHLPLSANGGLAFDEAGTLYFLSSKSSNPVLVTIDIATGALLSSVTYGPHAGLDGLVVRPGDGALLATPGNLFGDDQILRVDPVTGATTLLGKTGMGNASDLAFMTLPDLASDLVACNGVGGAAPGAVTGLDPESFAGTLLGDPVTPGGLSGLACTADGRLWGTSVQFGAGASELVEIDLATGAALGQTPIVDGAGAAVRISDLAVQPVSDVLFGVGGSGPAFGELFTIDTGSGLATLVGSTGLGADGGLAFDPRGHALPDLRRGGEPVPGHAGSRHRRRADLDRLRPRHRPRRSGGAPDRPHPARDPRRRRGRRPDRGGRSRDRRHHPAGVHRRGQAERPRLRRLPAGGGRRRAPQQHRLHAERADPLLVPARHPRLRSSATPGPRRSPRPPPATGRCST